MTNEGHTYIIEKIDADEYTIDKAGYKRNVTITLRDLTIGKTIKRRGTSKMIGNFSPIWINTLEGHKRIYVAVSDKDIPCKLERSQASEKQITGLITFNISLFSFLLLVLISFHGIPSLSFTH